MLSNMSITRYCTALVHFLLTLLNCSNICIYKPTNLYLGLQVSGRMNRSYS